MSRIVNYIKDTKGELKHVSWPTRRQTIAFTVIVILISVFVSALLGFFDYFVSQVLEKFIS